MLRETWTLRKIDADRLQAFHMRSLRQVVGVKWYDHVTNDAVRATTGVEDIESRIRRRRLGLFGHVVRLEPGVPVHCVCRSTSKMECHLIHHGNALADEHARHGCSDSTRHRDDDAGRCLDVGV